MDINKLSSLEQARAAEGIKIFDHRTGEEKLVGWGHFAETMSPVESSWMRDVIALQTSGRSFGEGDVVRLVYLLHIVISSRRAGYRLGSTYLVDAPPAQDDISPTQHST